MNKPQKYPTRKALSLDRRNGFFPGSGMFLFLALMYTSALYGQGTVRGTVTDIGDQSPLVSVAIIVKGTIIGTITDFNGEYMQPLKPGAESTFSC